MLALLLVLSTALFSAEPPASARILVVEHPAATSAFVPQPEPVRQLVRTGLTQFTGEKNVSAAWLSLVSTQDIIGIKVFSSPGPASGTRQPVVAALVETLLEAGVPSRQIIVWDRRIEYLRLAGYTDLARKYNIRVAGALDAGLDAKASYPNPLLGRLVYGDFEFGKKGEGIGRNSYVSTLLTEEITKIINVTPLLNHNYAGVSGSLYCLALGSVDNVLRFEDSGGLATAVPEIYALPEIADRVVLNVVDALICQYRGEERTLLHYSTTLNQLWFGTDPVALDVLALAELARHDKDRKLSGSTKAIYENAALLDLGVADPQRVKVERMTLE